MLKMHVDRATIRACPDELLVLFHLHKTDASGVGYFRWKEDICNLIEERWTQLCPHKARTASWMNSVSSVLSANTTVFESGFEQLKQPGWWALKHIQPPKPAPALLSDIKPKRKKVDEDDQIVDTAPTSASPLPTASSPCLDTAQTLLFTRHIASRIPNVNALLPSLNEATPTTVKAAQEIKRKLVERLLRVDSKLLQEALANSPVPSFAVTAPPLPFVRTESPRPVICDVDFKVGEYKDQKTKHAPSLKELRRLQKVAKPANYVRASPHENELLEMCLRVVNPDCTLNRFKRKLVMRRMKRRVGLSVLDIDGFMYRYLKSNDPLCLPDSEIRPYPAIDKHVHREEEDSKTFFDVPYRRDPSLSFLAKLTGTSCASLSYPSEVTSPYTGLRLPRFYHREYNIRPRKLCLLEQVQLCGLAGKAEDSVPIDFVPTRREWLPQVNRLLREFFWPAVDMTEALDYPDFGVTVLYKKLVIGCAFITPEGYMTYFMIHPEWAESGLGSVLLYLVLTKIAPPHHDLTLHVSATNPALVLYQKFGFKPEEYVVNFYDKYFKATLGNPTYAYSKNAYFMRYRR